MPGSAGGYDGDLLLKVQVGTKAGFERKEMDVYTKAMIPFTTAVFGGEVIVPTLYGKVLCTIRPGTQSGTKIRLRGKGIVSMNHKNMYGDQYVTVHIEVPKNLNAQAKEKLKETLYREMMAYDAGDPARIQHFVKVHSFAQAIGKAEKLEEEIQFILECAALVHDIGIKPAEAKYGKSDGKFQEQEGPAEAEKMMRVIGFEEAVIERVSYLVGHHHTYTNIDGMDYQILVEADFLVNYFENGNSADTIQKSVEKIFKTKTGKEMAETMFFPKPADLSLSETWAQDALQDLEDFIEEQGIYIRQ